MRFILWKHAIAKEIGLSALSISPLSSCKQEASSQLVGRARGAIWRSRCGMRRPVECEELILKSVSVAWARSRTIAGKSLHEPQAQIASRVLSSAPTLCSCVSRPRRIRSRGLQLRELEQRSTFFQNAPDFASPAAGWQSDFPPGCMRGWANYFWQLYFPACLIFVVWIFFEAHAS